MTRRQLFGLAILLLWAGLLGWHVRREYFPPELARLAEATLALDPGTNFYALTMGEATIGTSSSRLDTVPAGFVLEDQMNLDLLAMGQQGSAVVRSRVTLSRTLKMQEFSFALTSDAGAFAASGTVEGDTLVLVAVESGTGVENLSFRVPEAPLSASVLPIRLAMGGELEVGRVLRVPVFDPSTLSLRPVEVEVLARETKMLPDSAVLDPGTGRWVAADSSSVDAWQIRETFGGVSTESWIDGDGRIISSSSALGFRIERTAFDLAIQAQEDSRRGGAASLSGTDLIFSTAIASNVDLGEVEEFDELRFVLSGVSLDGFDLDGGRQELRGDTLIIRRESWEEVEPGYSLPYPRMDLREALEPEPLIQSGDPLILQMARSVSGVRNFNAPSPITAVDRLNRAVFQSMEKEVTLSIPSARQVLETLRGDCNEHTVLFLALARSIGIPARSAVGLVYLDGNFFYHAWPEVWLGEWVAVDPTFGQAPADAAHLRFITGSLVRQIEVARLIGNLRIEVILPPY